GVPPYDYTWSTGSTDTALHDLEIGQYSVTITDAENNYFSKSYFIDEPTELVLYLDVEGNEVQAAVLGGTQPYSFDWPLGDDVNTAIIPISGFFNVVVTDARGCEISQFFEIQTTVGISETIAQNIRVYPTLLPSNQNLQLELDLLQQSEVIAEVYNSAGQQVWSSAYSLGVGKHLQSISSPQFNTGLHLVKLQINGETITKKFVVE
ncbi:MAG: T9SS type A sorting domain-containing protein, partial [Chitinophagales bacterium]